MIYRYKPTIPKVDLQDNGFPKVFCPSDTIDFENIKWARFGSGGDARARHCFVDDWRLEHLWRRQGQGLAKAILNGVMTAPDFTIEKDFPLPFAEYQIWRSGVLAKFWQDNGVTVVPVLQWGNENQYMLCAKVIEKRSVVAVRGPQKGTEKAWIAAAEKIQQLLEPELVLHFGRKVEVWENPVYLKLNAKR